MSLFKRVLVSIAVTCALLFSCLGITACGEPIAATYKGGKITEAEVTETIENMRAQFIAQAREYGSTMSDEELWAAFVYERAYDTSSSVVMTAVEKAASQAPNAIKEDEDKGPGTVEDMRDTVIKMLIQQRLIEREIKDRRIEITDEELDQYVDQYRIAIESRLMEGVFESYLRIQGYKDLDAFRDSIREQLKQLKLQNEVSELAEDDGQEVSGKAAWNVWFDKLYKDADVKINPMPSDVPYAVTEDFDPSILEAAVEEAEGDEGAEGTE